MTADLPATGRARALLLVLFLAAAVFRLPGLSSPPTDIHHVRQADTASIARNFAREGIDLLHPRIDWAGPDAGTVESEFPLYTALTGLAWRVTSDTSPAWPRALSLLCWLLGGLGLARLVGRRLDGPTWVYLALYLFSPLALAFSRTVQPDALALCLLLWGLERADAAGDRGSLPAALAAGLLVGVAVAGKGTVAFVAPLAVLLAVGRSPSAARAIAVAAPGVLLPAAWYWHAHAHLGAEGATFGIWGSGAHKWGGISAWLDLATWRSVLGTFVTHALTPLGVALTLAGLTTVRRQPALRPWAVGLGLSGAAAVAVAEGFRLHNYYQLVFIPFASVLAGAGLLELRRRASGATAWALIVVLLGLGVLSGLQGLTFVQEALRRDSRIEVAGLALSHVVPAQKALAVVDRHPQTLLYAADRRGFHRTSVSYGDVLGLEEFGAEYLVVTETSTSWSDAALLSALQEERPLVARSPGWLLFQLDGGGWEAPDEATAAPLEVPVDAPAAPGAEPEEGPASGDPGE